MFAIAIDCRITPSRRPPGVLNRLGRGAIQASGAYDIVVSELKARREAEELKGPLQQQVDEFIDGQSEKKVEEKAEQTEEKAEEKAEGKAEQKIGARCLVEWALGAARLVECLEESSGYKWEVPLVTLYFPIPQSSSPLFPVICELQCQHLLRGLRTESSAESAAGSAIGAGANAKLQIRVVN